MNIIIVPNNICNICHDNSNEELKKITHNEQEKTCEFLVHQSCINEWAKISVLCPHCRQIMKTTEVTKLNCDFRFLKYFYCLYFFYIYIIHPFIILFLINSNLNSPCRWSYEKKQYSCDKNMNLWNGLLTTLGIISNLVLITLSFHSLFKQYYKIYLRYYLTSSFLIKLSLIIIYICTKNIIVPKLENDDLFYILLISGGFSIPEFLFVITKFLINNYNKINLYQYYFFSIFFLYVVHPALFHAIFNIAIKTIECQDNCKIDFSIVIPFYILTLITPFIFWFLSIFERTKHKLKYIMIYMYVSKIIWLAIYLIFKNKVATYLDSDSICFLLISGFTDNILNTCILLAIVVSAFLILGYVMVIFINCFREIFKNCSCFKKKVQVVVDLHDIERL